jgi:hypothetical protein
MTPPKWATEIVRYEAPGAPFRWRWSRRTGISTGTTYVGERERGFVVTASALAPHNENKVVLLHELAHWLLPKGIHHGPTFWRLAGQLYRKYGIPKKDALMRESWSATARRILGEMEWS